MKKKIYVVLLFIAWVLTSVSGGSVLAEEGNPLITFENDAVVTRGVGALEFGITDGCAWSKGRNIYINLFATPQTPISVTIPNLIVKFRFKIEAEEEGGSANYFQIRLFDESGEAEVYANTNRLMKNSTWYEGQIEVGKAAIADGKRGIKPGDVIQAINFMTRNTTGKMIRTDIDYIDIEQGVPSSWMIPDRGTEMIKNIMEQAAVAQPGEVIIIPNGIYSNVDLSIVATGAAGNPVTIQAETPGSVILNGSSRLTVDGDHVVIDGLYFKDAFNFRIIYFKPSSNYCRLTNSAILNGNDDDGLLDSHWVILQGKGHEVDHNYFRYKTAYSCLFDCNGVDFNVHHNYFGYFKEGNINGFETVRIFDTAGSPQPTNFLFEYNFFDRCDGEDEVISVKSDGNQFRYNTFYDSAGALTIRQGNDQEIYGNLFIGGKETTKTTGVRLMGNDVTVRNNYFYNLPTGSGAVVCEAGNPLGDPSLTYYPPTNALIQNNSFINCDISLSLNRFLGQGQYRTTPGEGLFENNLLVSFVGSNSMITKVEPTNGYTFLNNVAFGKPGGMESGFKELNPQLNKEGEFLYFPASPGIGAAYEELLKAPKTPMDLYEENSWIKAKIMEDGEKEFQEKSFQFKPITESTYSRNPYDANNIKPFNPPETFNHLFQSSETVTVNGLHIAGPKTIIFANISDAVGYHLKEYGMLFSKDDVELVLDAEGVIKVQAEVPKNRVGQYGILFHGANLTKQYTVRPYAIFESDEEQMCFYGTEKSFTMNP